MENVKGEIIDVKKLQHDDRNVAEFGYGEHKDEAKLNKAVRYAEDFMDEFSPVEEEAQKNFDSLLPKNESDLLNQPMADKNVHSSNLADFMDEPTYNRTGPLLIGSGNQKEPFADLGGVVVSEKAGKNAEPMSSEKPKKEPEPTNAEKFAKKLEQKGEIVKEQAPAPLEPRVQQTPEPKSLPPGILTMEKDRNISEKALREIGSNKKRVLDLIYWTNVRKSAIFFGCGFFALLCLALFPLLSVLAYTGLICITAGITIRLISMITSYFKKDISSPGPGISGAQSLRDVAGENYVESYMNALNLELKEGTVEPKVVEIVYKWNEFARKIRDIILAKNIGSTLKTAAGLWFMTYVSAFFSLAGLFLIAFVGVFTVPKFCQVYEKPLNHYCSIIGSKLNEIWLIIQSRYEKLAKKSNKKSD